MTRVTRHGGAEARRLWFSCMLVGAVTCGPFAIGTGAQGLSPPVRRLEVSVGAGLLGGAAIGEQAADQRAGGTGARYRLFDSETTLSASRSFEARVGIAVTRRVTLEARGALGRPELRTSLSSDAESAAGVTAVERVDEYLIDAGVVVRLYEWRLWGLVPFASGGAGYLRRVHEGGTLAEGGHHFHAGGGVTRWLFTRDRGLPRAAGLRADARVYVLSGETSLGDTSLRRGAIALSLVVVF